MSWRTVCAVVVAGCGAPSSPHYVDEAGAPIASYEAGWTTVHAFFGDAMPATLHVVRTATGPSRFDAETDTIMLSQESLKWQSEQGAVGHETTHLALAKLTAGASTLDELRFLDEGLATLIEERIERTGTRSEPHVKDTAAHRLHTGSVRIADLQQWSVYYGSVRTHADFTAYDVGAAFDYFVIDTFGEPQLRALLADLGRSRSLAESSGRILGRTIEDLEASWIAWLDTPAS